MIPTTLHFVIKGELDQKTGGYIYDARIIREMRLLGWHINVYSTANSKPGEEGGVEEDLGSILSGIEDNEIVILDGLVMGRHPLVLSQHAHRLRMISLLHHPLSKESGLTELEKDHLLHSEKAALASCIGVVTTSDFTSQQLSHMGVSESIIKTVIPGTDPSPVSIGPHKHFSPRFLCVASVIPRKGLDTLVDALSQILHLDWECICAGSLDRKPGYASDILKKVRDKKLSSRILFTGECSQSTIDKFYHISSIFVLPSMYEGYGMVLTEAATRGLPIISTTAGAIPNTLKSINAVLVPPGDTQSLAKAMEQALVGESRNSEGFTIRANQAQKHFPDWKSTTKTFEEAIKTLAYNNPRGLADG